MFRYILVYAFTFGFLYIFRYKYYLECEYVFLYIDVYAREHHYEVYCGEESSFSFHIKHDVKT
jgi:hypothetical protein